MPPRNAIELARFLPYRLSVLSNTVSVAIAGAYAKRFGLTIPEWRTIAVLASSPGLSAAEVAARTAMDKVAVSRAVAALLKAKRIERATAHSDRRRSMLRLTHAGEQVYARVVPVALQYEQELVQPLSPRELAMLDRVIALLDARARELGPLRPAPNPDELASAGPGLGQ
jgi:DNA-binding MarR family transcriptional regulator